MSRFRVALSDDFMLSDGSPRFPDFDLEPLRTVDRIDVGFVKSVDGIVSEQELRDYDALILLLPRIRRETALACPRLSLVARFGVGYDNVDVQGLAELGVATVITPKAVARPVAVGILTMILGLTGKALKKHALARLGAAGFAQRSSHMGEGLVGKTLGSIGLGNIAAETFHLCKPLDMKFIAHDPYVSKDRADELDVSLVDLESVFRLSDLVLVNCPLTAQTQRLIGERLLSLMKPTAYLINTARGPIVDQAALTRALQNRQIAGAGLDVFEPEPPDPDDPLLVLDNVMLAPHGIAWTDQCFAAVGAADVDAVLAIMDGREPDGIVDKSVCTNPRWIERLAAYRNRFG